MKVAYIEDDVDARTIFANKLKADQIFCNVYPSAEEALHSITAGSYDILIIDIRLPGIDGIQLLQKLRRQQIFTPCILITAFNSLEYSREALNSSANYLLEKPFSYQVLKNIIAKVATAPTSLQYCVDRSLAQLQLTQRENEIARYLLKGLSNSEIAKLLSIAENTVKQHVTQIFEKADVSSRSEFFSFIFPV
jgi:DNA-binding NarL/FixJ family response regulator